jgi:putative transposase
MNDIRHVQRNDILWDAMPKDLAPSSLCYDYWRVLTDGPHLESINHLLVIAGREKAGREASPTLAIIDAQSVKCAVPQGERGHDARKTVKGRKRHFAVEIGGRLLAMDVTLADIQDQYEGLPFLQRLVRLVKTCSCIKTFGAWHLSV